MKRADVDALLRDLERIATALDAAVDPVPLAAAARRASEDLRAIVRHERINAGPPKPAAPRHNPSRGARS